MENDFSTYMNPPAFPAEATTTTFPNIPAPPHGWVPPYPPNPPFPLPTTPFYHLPQFGPRDLSDWFVNMNLALMSIDAALHNMDIKVMRYPGKLESQIKELRNGLKDINDIAVSNSNDLTLMQDKMDATNTAVEQLQATIATQQLQIDNLGTRVQTSELNVAAMGTKVSNLDGSFTRVTAEFSKLKQDFGALNTLFKSMEDKQELFDKRIDDVEAKADDAVKDLSDFMTETRDKFDTVNSALDENQDAIAGEKKRNDKQDVLIQNLESKDEELESNIKTVESNFNAELTDVKSDIVNLEREDARLSTRVDGIENRFNDVERASQEATDKVEEVASNFDTIMDTVQNLVNTENGHNTRLQNLEDRADTLEDDSASHFVSIQKNATDIAQLQADVQDLSTRSDGFNASLAVVNTALTSYSNASAQLRSDVDALQNNMRDYGSVSALLRSDLDSVADAVADANNDINNLQTKTTSLQTAVNGVQADVAALQAQVNGHGNTLTTFSNLISQLRTDVDNIDTSGGGGESYDDTEVKGNIATLQTTVQSLSNRVTTMEENSTDIAIMNSVMEGIDDAQRFATSEGSKILQVDNLRATIGMSSSNSKEYWNFTISSVLLASTVPAGRYSQILTGIAVKHNTTFGSCYLLDSDTLKAIGELKIWPEPTANQVLAIVELYEEVGSMRSVFSVGTITA